ncbi:MAG: gamma-glutamyltransferase [Corallococcus sp.]|nr:gamma-glutamyltransferase [Corallococcus sp.]
MKNKLFVVGMSCVMALVMLFSFCACEQLPSVEEALAALDADASNVNLDVRQATGENGVVVSASAYASKAGMAVLEAGGNAFDAAVAVAFALGVVEPYASGVGGGGIMVGYQKSTGDYFHYNFREFTPDAGTKEGYEEASGKKGDATVMDEGILSVGVPTEVAGLIAINKNLGKMSLSDVLYPAIHYAENGIEVGPTMFDTIYDADPEVSHQTLRGVPGAEIFFNDFGKLQVGDTLVQKDYAKVLKEIAAKGKDGFYKGWVAEAIIDAMENYGGIVTMEDLAFASENYPVISRPTTGTYGDYSIVTSTTPSSGGTILIEALNMLEYYQNSTGQKLSEMDRSSAEYVNVMATAMQLAYGDKTHFFGDFNFVNVPNGLLSKEYAATRWNQCYSAESAYTYSGAGQYYYGDPSEFSTGNCTVETIGEDDDDHGTTAFTVVDKDGNIASFTQTINHFWGAYIIPTGCGFFLNNQMSSATFTSGGSAFVRPYKQPTSHIMPTLVLNSVGEPVLVLGSPGSMRIPSAVLNTLVNYLDFGMDIQAAIETERIYNYGNTKSSGKKVIEIESPSEDLVLALNAMNYKVTQYNGIDLYFGGVHAVSFNYQNGQLVSLTGGADTRRDGKALAY